MCCGVRFFRASAYTEHSDADGGFFSVYGRVFADIEEKEIRAENEREDDSDDDGSGLMSRPSFGSSSSPPSVVRAFYAYWSSFASRRSFSFRDKWRLPEAPNRQIRRAMEVDNRKERFKARKEYSELVRELASWVRKRDRRLLEAERKEREDERRRADERKNKLKADEEVRRRERSDYAQREQQRWEEQERARRVAYGDIDEEERKAEKADRERRGKADALTVELECVVCRKMFKSEQQWQNHERSRKHRDALERHRRSAPAQPALSDAMECAACGVVINDAEELVEHDASLGHQRQVERMQREMDEEEEAAQLSRDLERIRMAETNPSLPTADERRVRHEEQGGGGGGDDDEDEDDGAEEEDERARRRARKDKKQRRKQRKRMSAFGPLRDSDVDDDDERHGSAESERKESVRQPARPSLELSDGEDDGNAGDGGGNGPQPPHATQRPQQGRPAVAQPPRPKGGVEERDDVERLRERKSGVDPITNGEKASNARGPDGNEDVGGGVVRSTSSSVARAVRPERALDAARTLGSDDGSGGEDKADGANAAVRGTKSGLSAKAKKKEREERKRAKVDAAHSAAIVDPLTCAVCRAAFDSRNALMKHVKERKHAAPLSSA